MRRLHLLLFALVLALPLPASAAGRHQIIVEAEPEEMHLVFPQDPDLTWFLDTFGAGRAGGHRHVGIDLHAPKGTPVFAVAAGVVTRMSVSARPGYYLAIDHGPGWESWYMHLDNDDPGTDNGRGGFHTAFAPGLAVGAFVDAGTLVGFVGDSGNAEHTLPHTHFELHRNGRPINPYLMLVEAQQRALLALHAERFTALSTPLD